jgi:hypothetical protein
VSSTTVKVIKWAGRKAIAAATPTTNAGPQGSNLTCPAEPKRRGKRCGKPVRNSGRRGRGGKTDNLTCGHPDCATWYAVMEMGL